MFCRVIIFLAWRAQIKNQSCNYSKCSTLMCLDSQLTCLLLTLFSFNSSFTALFGSTGWKHSTSSGNIKCPQGSFHYNKIICHIEKNKRTGVNGTFCLCNESQKSQSYPELYFKKDLPASLTNTRRKLFFQQASAFTSVTETRNSTWIRLWCCRNKTVHIYSTLSFSSK